MDPKEEILIVGQGLAGTILAWHLFAKKEPFRILDRDGGAHCSRVAGGMINPISPRLPTLSWRADTHIPEARSFYRWVGKELGTELFHPLTMVRPIPDAAEAERWKTNAIKKGFESFLTDSTPDGVEKLPSFNGAALMAFEGASLDVENFLVRSRRFFSEKGKLLEGEFDPGTLRREKASWIYQGASYRQILLAQGTAVTECPYFGSLPLRPNKGEILTLHMPDFPEDLIFTRNFYLIPIGDGQVRLGATYDHQDLSPGPTQEKRADLLGRMEEWIPFPYSVLEQRVGFRPTTPDTRPYAGPHKEWEGLAVFNGLGSKGIAFAPHWGRRLVEELLTGEGMSPSEEVDPWRFEKKKKNKA